jgi:hypothetical protein
MDGDAVDIIVQGVIDFGCNGPHIRRLISISGQDEWENYMSVVMTARLELDDGFDEDEERACPSNEDPGRAISTYCPAGTWSGGSFRLPGDEPCGCLKRPLIRGDLNVI